MTPRIPRAQFSPTFVNEELRRMVRKLAEEPALERPIVWTYTPSAVGLLNEFRRSILVYDCMDELSAFMHAPQELRDQEKELLHTADIVFTGGPSLYKAKKDLHPEVYCFASSVDVGHFRKRGESHPEPADQARIAGPRLGYVGVIDERMDLGLVERIARERPEWQIILVGPVVKIDPQRLPQLPNIHYMGGRKYDELPSYIQGWDVCLMPFALNESTKFISPTKVLEYMAAGKEIVSTAITDVVEPYAEIVRIGNDPAEFVTQCDRALGCSIAERERRQGLAEQVLSRTSWEKTAEAMDLLMDRRRREVREELAEDETEYSEEESKVIALDYELSEAGAVLVEARAAAGGVSKQ